MLRKITWSNLWHQFMFYPGTMVLRLKLVMWQVWLMTASSTGAWIGGFSDQIGGFVGGVIGFSIAWLSHELGFRWYCEGFVHIDEVDMHPVNLGKVPTVVHTIERYVGPMGSDRERV